MFALREARFALDAVRRATCLARQIQKELVTESLTKDDRSPVTLADFAAQALVGRLLDEAFPGDRLVGEENAGALRAGQETLLERLAEFVGREIPGADPASVCQWIDRGAEEPAGRYWTLDPVDGTKGFLRGDQYAVAFALVENGRVVFGALGCPHLTDGCRAELGGPGSILAASRGEGTWTCPLEGGPWRPLRVSERSDPAEARVLRSVEAGHTDVDAMSRLTAALRSQAEPVCMDSQAKYAVLASGEGDLLLRLLSPSRPDYREKIWDQAAGSIIVEEAGGQVTDLDGRPLDFSRGRTLAANRGILASNGRLHAAALAALRAIGA